MPCKSIASALLLALATTLALAQTPDTAPAEATTLPALEARIAALEASGTAPEALASFREAATYLSQTSDLAASAAEFDAKAADAPARLEEVRTQLDAPLKATPPAQLAALPLEELETALATTRAELDNQRARLTSLESEAEGRTLRTTAIPATNTQLTTRLEDLNATIAATPPPSPDTPVASAADSTKQLSLRELLTQTIDTNNRELAYLNSTADLLTAQRALAARQVSQLTSELENLQNAADAKRRTEADSDSDAASTDADLKHPVPAVAAIAKENAELAALRAGEKGITAQIRKANTTLATVTSELESRSAGFHNAKRRVDLVAEAGFSLDESTGESTGELLRRERHELTDPDLIRADIRAAVHRNTAAGLELIKLEQQRRDLLADFEANVEAVVTEGTKKPEEARAAARRLLTARSKLFDQLVTDYRALTTTIAETNQKRRALIERTEAYGRLIDERVLWFRSAPVFDGTALTGGLVSIATVFYPSTWTSFFNRLNADIQSAPLIWSIAALVFVFLLVRRRSYRHRLILTSKTAARKTCTTFLPTAKALGFTALIVIPVPALLAFVALRHGDIDSGGIASGLFEITQQLLILGFLRRACAPDGLAISHFRLAEQTARTLHRYITVFLLFAVPSAFVLGVLDSLDGQPGGRLIFIVAMLTFAVFSGLILRPSRHLITGTATRAVAIVTGIIMPAFLVIGAVVGYFYTVRELQWRLEASLSAILAILLFTAVATRWFLVARRRIAIEQARQKRRAALAKESNTTDSEALTQEEIEAAAFDVTKIKDQTSQLLRSAAVVTLAFGLWGIWAQVLPALNILDNIHLWADSNEREQLAAPDSSASKDTSTDSPALSLPGLPSPTSETSEPSAPSTETQPSAQATTTTASTTTAALLAEKPADPNYGWVTLADLALCLLTFVLTYIAAKNIPGLLDISLLRRLQLKPGGSFAVTASARYLIVLVGIILAFSFIGVTWSKVQWIAAAVTVGIGFGLQEVFANFVAGLILLFERPIRLGDFVTVGTVSGQVTRIEIRATTIRDFSNKELIVPNKEFITGQLVNWTLTDSVIRVEIAIGVAYGSDTELARDLLLRVARDNPLTVKEPGPQALFLGFGASSLDFELRVHIDSVANLVPVRNDLHFAIDKTFREHGIEIAFPQTDIHIRSMPEKSSLQNADPPSPDTA